MLVGPGGPNRLSEFDPADLGPQETSSDPGHHPATPGSSTIIRSDYSGANRCFDTELHPSTANGGSPLQQTECCNYEIRYTSGIIETLTGMFFEPPPVTKQSARNDGAKSADDVIKAIASSIGHAAKHSEEERREMSGLKLF